MDNPDNPPFEAWSIPDENQPHMQLTNENVEFALNEIFEGEIPQDNGGQDDNLKPPAIIFVQNPDGGVYNGQVYRHGRSGAARNNNGNSNAVFGNIGDWSVDLVISERPPENAANDFQGYKEEGHPLFTGTINLIDHPSGEYQYPNSEILSMNSSGMGALGWGSFAANTYNRSSGVGSVALGFHNIAGQPFQQQGLSYDNMGAFAVGFSNRSVGNRSFTSGTRNFAGADDSHAMGSWNYATGNSSIAIGKENWAEGASTVAIGFKTHAAGDGSVALGQENLAWGTTNFTAGYQNVAGDTNAGVGTAGSATAIGRGNLAQGRSSFAANRFTSAINQASASLGLGTTSDNFGMLAVGVNNASGIGDTTVDPNDYGGYYYADGSYTGSTPGVAFVVGNGDIDSGNGGAGSCLLYTSPSPRDKRQSRMPSSA